MPPSPNNDDIEDIGLVEQGTTQEAQGPGATTLGVAGYSINVDNRALPYVGILASATVLLIAFLVPAGKFSNENYGISICVVSTIFALFGVYMTLMNHGLYENPLGTFPVVGNLTLGTAVAYILFLWNFVAASILTFNGPFLVTSNGYFAVWGLVVFSIMAMGITTEAVRSQASSIGYHNALLVAVVIQLCAIIPEMGDGNGRPTYSLVLCIVTSMLVLAFGAYPGMASLKLPVFSLLAIFWLVMACLVTFKGPFVETGNGYFSAWAGFLLTLMVAAAS